VTARSRPCPRRRLTRARGHGPLRWGLGLFVGAPGAVFASRGMGLWCGCTVDGNLPDRPRCPCSPTVRQLNRQTAQPATRRAIGSQQLPRAASGPSLWPSAHEPSFSSCALAAQAQSATTSRSPPGSRSVRAGGSVSQQRRWCSLVGSVVGGARPRSRDGTIGPSDRAASQVSRPIHEARHLNLPVEPGVRDGRNALVRWMVFLEEVLP